MKRWSKEKRDFTESAAIDAFLEEVIAVCKKHGLSIAHEDSHGAFEVTEYDEHASEWLREASDRT